jgi:hypothetical protein
MYKSSDPKLISVDGRFILAWVVNDNRMESSGLGVVRC